MIVLRAAWLIARYLIALAAVAIFLFPLYWLVITALKPTDEILTYPPVWWPEAVDVARVLAVAREGLPVMLNSLIVAFASTLLAVGLGTIGGFAIGRSGRAGSLIAGWTVASRMAPPVMLALPFLLVLTRIGRAEGIIVLTLLVAAVNLPYVVWMMRGYVRDIPAALFDMAEVAGLSDEEIRRRVLWPMTRGGLIATAAFTFLLAWNELAFALLFGGDANTTLMPLLARSESRPELWSTTAALAVVGMVPALVALLLMQRRLARSLSLGLVRD